MRTRDIPDRIFRITTCAYYDRFDRLLRVYSVYCAVLRLQRKRENGSLDREKIKSVKIVRYNFYKKKVSPTYAD